MTTTLDAPRPAPLLAAALQTSHGMREVAQGKADDAPLGSDARSFAGISRLLELLVREVERQEALAQARGDALARIADLRIRGGVRLIEAGRWQDIATELREIAGETLTGPPAAPGAASPGVGRQKD